MEEDKKPQTPPKKKRSFRRGHLEDFQRNVAGEYIYTGPTHRWVSPRGKNLGLLWLWGGAAFCAALAGGCVPGCRMEQYFWALGPYILALLFSSIQLWKLIRLTEGGDPVRDYVWTATVKPMPVLNILTAIFAGVAAAAELVVMLLPEFSGRIYTAFLYILLELLVFVVSMAQRRQMLRLEWT